VDRLVAEARATTIGPLVDGVQRDKVARLVDDALARGARALTGGTPGDGPGTSYPPTVLVGVTDSMEIAHRETFGPVACVRVVDDAEEAVAVANRTDYGLGATVWTGDAERAEALAARIQAGMIGINRGIRGVGDTPWVGARQSGFGYTGSVDGTRSFTQPRTITRETSREKSAQS
jgi:succinate-semialdehyde dehydrogenase/glutarate-semialdehyde dehydrogenase